LESERNFKETREVYDELLVTLLPGLEKLSADAIQMEKLNEPLKNIREELYRQKQSYGSVYIAYLKFTRRAEGLESFRAIFQKAMKDKWTPWEVYEAAGNCLF
jgi:hypothetical protein